MRNHEMNAKPCRQTLGRRGAHRAERGFTLLEMAIVLVVIGLILGAVMVGKDVQRNAVYQRVANDFVQGWAIAYDRYYDGTGIPPGDTATSPTGMVNHASSSELCGSNLISAMQAAGVPLPEGRAAGSDNKYVYQDSNGLPHELEVCFENVPWSEPDGSGGLMSRPRNVMVLKGMTPALANLIDSNIDGHADARFGNFREASQSNDTTHTSGIGWSIDERMAYGSTTATSLDESQVAEISAGYLKMTR